MYLTDTWNPIGAFSNDLLDLDAKVQTTLAICHLEVLPVAGGAPSHGIELLLGHYHDAPMLLGVQRL